MWVRTIGNKKIVSDSEAGGIISAAVTYAHEVFDPDTGILHVDELAQQGFHLNFV